MPERLFRGVVRTDDLPSLLNPAPSSQLTLYAVTQRDYLTPLPKVIRLPRLVYVVATRNVQSPIYIGEKSRLRDTATPGQAFTDQRKPVPSILLSA